jgi:hypothetical protein
MAQGFPNSFNVDSGNSNSPYAAEAWIEPWLLKHSTFYRKHLTRDGRQESKSSRRASMIDAEIQSRKNSVAATERKDSEDSTAAGAVPEE